MSDRSMHLTEETLILHFYGEAPDRVSAEEHLVGCPACQRQFARLQQTLALLDTADAFSPTEQPGPAFEREVWARLEPQLAATRRAWLPSWLVLPRVSRLAFVGSAATLLLVAFLAGRFSRDVAPPTESADATSSVAQRVLVVAVVDHLDRSQMVLLEVMNADVDSAGELAAEQSRARELVSANRLYRQTAQQTGDGSTTDVLDELERVLLEIANAPSDATRDDLDALRARITQGGLLFKVRVVHSEMLERGRQTMFPGSQS